MKTTGEQCTHCKGNIVWAYDNIGGERKICLQCGRYHPHKCDDRCKKIRRKL